MSRIVPNLWYTDKAEEAAAFYVSLLPDSKIDGVTALPADTPSGPAGSVKVSFFGGIGFGRVKDPLKTCDGTLLVASLDDLMATKLKATLDRAEARDYRDIAEMIAAGVSLSSGLGAFRRTFKGEPSQVLRAIGYFKDGDLPMLAKSDQELLRSARDQILDVPDVPVTLGTLATPLGDSSAESSTLS